MKTRLLITLLIAGLMSNAQSFLTIGEVFDFEIGDEFHLKSQLPNETPNAERQTIIAKEFSNSNDTVFYTIARDNYVTAYEEYPEPHLEYYFFKDTISKHYTNLDSLIFVYNGCIPYDTLIENSEFYCDSLINGYSCYVGEFEPDFYIDEFGKGIGQVYEYVVFGECGSPDLTTSIGETEIDEKLNIYPNPAENFVQIIFDNNKGKYLIYQVFDLKGKLIRTYCSDNNTIDITNLNSGLYILKIQIESKIVTRKLIIE